MCVSVAGKDLVVVRVPIGKWETFFSVIPMVRPKERRRSRVKMEHHPGQSRRCGHRTTSAVDGNIPLYNGTTGKIIKDGLLPDTDASLGAASNTRVPTQKAVHDFVETQAGLLVAKALGTAKGDTIAYEASGKPVRHAAGANGNLLGFDSAQSDGLASLKKAQITGLAPYRTSSGQFLHVVRGVRSSVQQNTGQKSAMFLLPVDVAVETEFDRIACFVGTKGEGGRDGSSDGLLRR